MRWRHVVLQSKLGRRMRVHLEHFRSLTHCLKVYFIVVYTHRLAIDMKLRIHIHIFYVDIHGYIHIHRCVYLLYTGWAKAGPQTRDHNSVKS